MPQDSLGIFLGGDGNGCILFGVFNRQRFHDLVVGHHVGIRKRLGNVLLSEKFKVGGKVTHSDLSIAPFGLCGCSRRLVARHQSNSRITDAYYVAWQQRTAGAASAVEKRTVAGIEVAYVIAAFISADLAVIAAGHMVGEDQEILRMAAN